MWMQLLSDCWEGGCRWNFLLLINCLYQFKQSEIISFSGSEPWVKLFLCDGLEAILVTHRWARIKWHTLKWEVTNLASQQSFLVKQLSWFKHSWVALGVKSDWYHNIGTATAGWTVLIYSHLFLITGFISQLLQTIDLCRKLVLLHNMALTDKWLIGVILVEWSHEESCWE